MKVARSNTITIELEEGDTAGDLYQALSEVQLSAPVCWIPLGHNRPGLFFKLATD